MKANKEVEKIQKQTVKILKEEWNILLVGKVAVVKNPNSSAKLNHWLVIEFVGGRKEAKKK